MSLIVKAYLEKPDKTEEIRRFALDQDVASNFDYLTKKLTKVFPGLDDNCAIFWKGKPDFIFILVTVQNFLLGGWYFWEKCP